MTTNINRKQTDFNGRSQTLNIKSFNSLSKDVKMFLTLNINRDKSIMYKYVQKNP